MKKLLAAIILGIISLTSVSGKDHQLQSPDKHISVTVTTINKIYWSIRYNEDIILQPSQIALNIKNNIQPGINPVLVKQKFSSVYVMYESPLQMLADNPSNYLKDSVCTAFISRIPTTWDQTVAIDGKVGEYALIARKKSDIWYISGMTDWNARTLALNLSFLDGKTYNMDVLGDGINADKHASDYKISHTQVRKGNSITVKMKNGGGWCAILTPQP